MVITVDVVVYLVYFNYDIDYTQLSQITFRYVDFAEAYYNYKDNILKY